MSIFKAGSIRGRWNEEWNRDTAFLIGYHLNKIFDLKTIVIGQDGRNSSYEICDALTEGLVKAGCNVSLISTIDTPGLCFANIEGGFDASIMITASHNPPDYNGLKISGRNALVISRKNGLAELERLIQDPADASSPGGSVERIDIRDKYLNFFTEYKKECGPVKCVVDCSNGMGAVLIHKMIKNLPGEYIILNELVSGDFPGHGPNPTEESNLDELKKRVIKEKADLGICFDGDGDRTIFIDEKGRWISPDIILALLGLYYFKHFPEKRGSSDGVLYDARSTNSIKTYIEALGGKTYMCKTGHTAMQVGIPDNNAVMGGELPGHYYYRDFFSLDNGWIPFFQVQTILSLEDKAFSTLADEINLYSFSGEINFRFPDGLIEESEFIQKFKDIYHDGEFTLLDGIRIDYEKWWFLARFANTEPIMRLVVEGETPVLMKNKVKEISEMIYALGGVDHSG